eukprot:scaffold1140_cov241-Chaetoceros_neogracile.AAC.3
MSKKHGILPRQARWQVYKGLTAIQKSHSGLSQTEDGFWNCMLCLPGIMTSGNATRGASFCSIRSSTEETGIPVEQYGSV